MPQGRLNHEDRRRITAGLAEGLGYAEIARQLGRPTSTISREVARNGGPESYRADHAHRATALRARRRRPAPPQVPPDAVDAHGRDPEAARGFVERFAALLAGAGLPRMAARVLACLITNDSGAMTAAELVYHLRVSPASVSKAVGHLEGLAAVRRELDPGRRRERYLVDDDVWPRTWLTSASTNARWADVARHGAAIFGESTPAGARLDHMSRFFARLGEDRAAPGAAAEDMLTAVAALVHAGRPRTVDQLATGLGWSPARVTGALGEAGRRQDITDPVAVLDAGDGTYTVTVRPGRLTPAQRAALGP